MKKIYTTLVLLTVALISFSQSFYVYTAKASGLWTQAMTWNTSLRTDGVQKNKVIVPKNFNIIADNDVNNMGLGSIEMLIAGTMTLLPGTKIGRAHV